MALIYFIQMKHGVEQTMVENMAGLKILLRARIIILIIIASMYKKFLVNVEDLLHRLDQESALLFYTLVEIMDLLMVV